MTDIDDRRLPLALAKLPLLSAAPSTSAAEFRGVEDRMPFFIRIEPNDQRFPRGCLSDEHALITLLAPLVAKANVLGPMHEPLEISPTELGRQLGAGGGHDARVRAIRSLHRLANTMVTTDYITGGRREISHQPLLALLSTPARGAWTVSLSPLLIDQVFRRHLIKPPIEYFEAKGLRRRIWSASLAFCGKRRPTWRMPMLELWRRSGSIDAGRKFAFAVRTLCDAGSVPGFKLSVEDEGRHRFFVMAHDPNVRSAPSAPPQSPENIIFLGIDPEPARHIAAELHLNLDIEEDEP